MKRRSWLYTLITMAWIYLAAMLGNKFFPGDWVADIVLCISFGSLAVAISLNLEFLIVNRLSKLSSKVEER